MRRHALSRRTFLGAASSTLALPLLQSLPARAQDNTPPKRLVIFFSPNGVNPDVWFPTAGASETDFTLNPTHASLEPFKQDLVFLRGVNMESLQLGPGEPHQRGMGAVLTGTHLQEGTFVGGDGTLAGWGNGISVDQHIANQLNPPTSHKTVQLGVRVLGSEVRHRLNYAGPAQPLPPQNNPRIAFNSMFGNLTVTPSEGARLRAQRSSILDATRRQFLALRPKLSVEDRQKLDYHHTLVRDMELRLDAQVGASESCVIPSEPSIYNFQVENEDKMDDVAIMQMDLLAMALTCDVTRIATLQFSSGANNIRFPWLNSYSDDHSLSHAGPADVAGQQEWANRKRWYSEQFAYFLNKLRSTPEGNGTLLDNTLVVWVSELAQGNTHSHANMPFVLAGSCGGAIQTGRYLQFNSARHNDLLVSIMNAMGVSGSSFGDPNYCSGPLAGLA